MSRPTLLAVDVGNTAIKTGLFRPEGEAECLRHEGFAGLYHYLTNLPERTGLRAIASKVGRLDDEQEVALSEACGGRLLRLRPDTPLPFENRYATPETLGADRLAAIAGALALRPGKAALAVDMGTCVTFDYADAQGRYLGGAISPGLRMRFAATHRFTASLPLVEPGEAPPGPVGDSTAASLRSGIALGLRMEVDGRIGEFRAREGASASVFLTGGDAPFFESSLEAPNFAEPNLVLIGLKSVLAHNL